MLCHSRIDICACGSPKWKVAKRCSKCVGRKSNGIKPHTCPVCDIKFYTNDRSERDNSVRFCNPAHASYGTYVCKLATRRGIDFKEAYNYLQAGFRWCGLGKHWAHLSEFWPDRTHKVALGLATYCRPCYSKKHGNPNAQQNITKSDLWKPNFLKLLESIGSINRVLKKVKVSWPTYNSRIRNSKEFEQQVHAAKQKFYQCKYGSTVTDFSGWHKRGYEIRKVNEETYSFVLQNKATFEAWIKSAAFKWGRRQAEPHIDEIINLATLMFLYSRFKQLRNFDRLARFYGRCATFQILKRKY